MHRSDAQRREIVAGRACGVAGRRYGGDNSLAATGRFTGLVDFGDGDHDSTGQQDGFLVISEP